MHYGFSIKLSTYGLGSVLMYSVVTRIVSVSGYSNFDATIAAGADIKLALSK
jgi:hypothetical protein